MMARTIRIGLWLAAVAVILVASVWMLLPVLVSSELVRAAIERELADITGQRMRVEGQVDVDLFPAPVARLYDVHVPSDAQPETGSAGDFLVVERVDVSVPFASLMARDPEFSQFRLVRPTVRVQVDAHGQLDVAAVGGRIGREIERMRNEAGGDASTSPDYARFGTVAVEGGIIEFVGPDAAKAERITAISGSVAWPRLDEKLTASLSGIWRGAAFDLKTDIDEALRFFTGQVVGMRQALTSDVLTYSFEGTMGVGETPYAEGKMTLKTPSPRQALDWLGTGMHTGGAVGAVTLSANMQADARKLRLDALKIDMQGSTGAGVLELALRDDGRPAVIGTLDFQEIDLLAFLSAFTGSPRTTDALAEPVSGRLLDQFDADLRLSAAGAAAGALRLSKVAIVTQIRKGEAIFEMPDAIAYGGHVQARLKLFPEGGTVIGAVNMMLTDLDGAAAADALQVSGLFPRGMTTGSLKIRAPMDHWNDLFKRAEGEMKLTVSKGQVVGVAFKTLGGEGEDRRFFRLRDGATTGEVFDKLEISGLIQDGVIIVDNGAIDYPAGTVLLNGVIPYRTSSIALTTVAETKQVAGSNGDAPAAAIQHFVGGSWSNPYATPVLQSPVSPPPIGSLPEVQQDG